MTLDNFIRYQELRENYPLFSYEKFTFELTDNDIKIQFEFNLSDKVLFHPKYSIPLKDRFLHDKLPSDHNKDEWENLVFHLGMIELISYWKAACAPSIIIKPFTLNQDQIAWWKKLYLNGLGEFFYTNGIPMDIEHFEIKSSSNTAAKLFTNPMQSGAIIPVGGGKDSAVTLELISDIYSEVYPFVINSRPAVTDCIEVSGYSSEETIAFNRTIDPELIRLNGQGFLNGHTPFSALLAFATLIPSYLTGSKDIVLSNESSANEPTIPGTDVNHQYSKSYGFEQDFRSYCKEYISSEIEYFSFLRPLTELQIASIFSKYPAYHKKFRSCNVGSKTNSWCCSCSKCLFTYIILSPFMDPTDLISIFGQDLFDDKNLLQDFKKLAGMAKEKPFECVGTIEEVNQALVVAIEKYDGELPFLLDFYKNMEQFIRYSEEDRMIHLSNLDRPNNLTASQLTLLKKNLT